MQLNITVKQGCWIRSFIVYSQQTQVSNEFYIPQCPKEMLTMKMTSMGKIYIIGHNHLTKTNHHDWILSLDETKKERMEWKKKSQSQKTKQT